MLASTEKKNVTQDLRSFRFKVLLEDSLRQVGHISHRGAIKVLIEREAQFPAKVSYLLQRESLEELADCFHRHDGLLVGFVDAYNRDQASNGETID